MSRYTLDWSFGLRSSAGKYLTAESFQFKLGATSNSMKKKQIFFLEQAEGQSAVYIRTHLGKYLSVDDDGKFLANGESAGENEAFIIEAQPDGRWLLKSNKHGWYAGGSGENLSAFTTEPTEEKHWTVHLAMHPQVCLKNVKRTRYVHLSDGGDQLTTDEDIPWGHDATLFIEFCGSGAYKLQASNGQYLTASGNLAESQGEDPNCEFILEFKGGTIALKNRGNGNYVTSLGATGLLKSTKKSVTKDESYVMEDSFAQATLRSKGNGKLVSIKQGVECAATCMDEPSDNEIFQLEPTSGGKWIIKTCKNKLWREEGGSIQSDGADGAGVVADTAPAESQFGVDFNGDHVCIVAPNGKYVFQQMNGYLKAGHDDGSAPSAQFVFDIINRPKLVLRGPYGFLGTLPSKLLECNKSTPEVYNTVVKDGKVAVAAANGEFWKVGPNGISANGGSEEWYTIALYKESKLTLMTEDGKLMKGSQNGAFTADGSDASSKECLWEY